jgi:hypothetical protein
MSGTIAIPEKQLTPAEVRQAAVAERLKNPALMKEAQDAAILMVAGISRFRKAILAMQGTIKAIGQELQGKPGAETIRDEWRDLVFIVNCTIGGLERAWREPITAGSHPTDSTAYAMAKAVVWDHYQHVKALSPATLDKIRERMGQTGAWPIEIIFEEGAKNLCPTWATDGKSASAAYTRREPTPGSAAFTYPSFSVHFAWQREAAYYQTVINLGRILEIVRSMTGTLATGNPAPLPGRMGTVYQAALVYAYYDMIIGTSAYYDALDEYNKCINNEPDATFDFIHGNLPTGGAKNYRWLDVVQRAATEAYSVCSDYYATAGGKGDAAGNGAGLFAGLDADALRDPSQIAKLLEPLGLSSVASGFDLNSLTSHPLLAQVMRSFGGGSA